MTTLTHIRTVNGGTPQLITREQAADEVNTAANDRTGVIQMSTTDIHYRDGRHVQIRNAATQEIEGLTTVGQPHIRIAGDGPAKAITFLDAITEINAALGGSLRHAVHDVEVRGTHATIPYTDGATVIIRPATLAELDTIARETADSAPVPVERTADGGRIVTVKSKRYVAWDMKHGQVWYWSERNGKRFGPTQSASAECRPGTVGAAIWATVNR